MTEFLPHIRTAVVEIDGKQYSMAPAFYSALSRAFQTLNASDSALIANDAAITAILQSLGAEDVASLQALGDLLAGKQDKDEALTSLSQLTATGLLSFTGGNFNSRTLSPVAGETTVTNGNGVAGNPTVGLANVADSGAGSLLAVTRDGKGRITGTKAATITGTAGRVTVANGTAAAGLPTIDLAPVTDAGGGTLQRTAFDTYGRKTGTSAATTDHLTEGATNLYHTAARVRAVALTGLSTATNAVITATDTVLSAFGKLQAQVTANLSRSVHTGTQLASTISDFAATVRATVLTGLSTATATAVTAADSVLVAVGKLQAQVSDREPTITAGTSAQLWRGDKVFSNTIAGPFGVGYAPSTITYFGTNPAFSVIGAGGSSFFSSARFDTSAFGPDFALLKSKNATIGSHSLGADGDHLGSFSFFGSNGTGFFAAARVIVAHEGTPSATSTPGRIVLATTPAGATTTADRWYLRSTGHFEPAADNAYNVGSAALRTKEIFSFNSAINTSDAREKTPPRKMTPAEVAAASDIARLPNIFQWLAAVEEKGEAARLHCSPTVQAVMGAMQAHGLDPFRYGFVCYDKWEAQHIPAQLDEDGKEVEPARTLPAGDRYSLRPAEMLAFVQSAIVARLDALEGIA